MSKLFREINMKTKTYIYIFVSVDYCILESSLLKLYLHEVLKIVIKLKKLVNIPRTFDQRFQLLERNGLDQFWILL